uniref:cysteine-rich receptor-like protein kinase 2 isoform X2 n=1 Tax=Erigeron canadensis TaxID=72917 RepID=UPI001CB991F2|nr:cysteine-rich receptor-like protein kinase 2 isoform X2 [Erigeron canadensis]
MKQVENLQLSRLITTTLFVIVLIILMIGIALSQPNDRNSTVMTLQCSRYYYTNEGSYLTNLNATLTELRLQLTRSGGNAEAHMPNGDAVWGVAWCRGYLSVPECLDCFDYGVGQLKTCGSGYVGHVIYNDCDVRYESYNFIPEASDRASVALCDSVTSLQPTEFQTAAEKLLLDLQIVAPRTPNFYAVSTRQIADGNATVYAIAQCNLNISQSVCLECLKSISSALHDCLPTISGRGMDNGCFMRYSSTPFFRQNQTMDLTSLLWNGHSTKKRSIILGVIGGLSFLLLVIAFLLWRCRLRMTGRSQQDLDLKGAAVNYNYKHLQTATNNFSKEKIIGKGGYGEVFKATLDDKKVVAVKKLKVGFAGAKVEFENEILLISNIHHRNLLRLLGWSSGESNLLLVLEYMPNGSLDSFLWGAKRGTLNWKQRYDIILGIAKGLAHLHEELHVKIIHRDIKSSNILLDDDFQPKIADFGMARFQAADQSHVTTKFAGTLGYTAPEYALYGALSDKVDTFSFGVVILEIISGRRCTDSKFNGLSTDGLLEHAWDLYEYKEYMNLVDETMDSNQYEDKQVMEITEIALLCTQVTVSKRPNMSEVVWMLSNHPSFAERQLTRPNFIDHNRKIHKGSS